MCPFKVYFGLSRLHQKSRESCKRSRSFWKQIFLEATYEFDCFVQVEKEATKAEQDSTRVLKRLMLSSKQKSKRRGYVFAFVMCLLS